MRSLDLSDRLLALALAIITLAYLASLPRYLGWADESYFLYEAKRIRDGEVMYRDIFQFITPLASYFIALLYWLFGTTITTARLAMATIHGLLCSMLFVICRALGVRRSLTLVVPLAFLSLCQPVWPFASPHWFSTATTMGVLSLLIVAAPSERGKSRGAVVGVLLGVLIGLQQQKGLIITAAACLITITEWLLDRRHPRAGSLTLLAQLAWLLAGVLAIVVPLGLWMIANAGVRPVYEALIVFPLESYRHGHFIRWGAAAPLTDSFAAATWPSVLRWSPVVLVAPLARLLHGLARGGDATTPPLATLIIFGAASTLSIWYFPDLIHIAFIAPVFLVCAADTLEWLLRWPRAPRFSLALGAAVAVVLASGLGYQLWWNTMTMRHEFTIPHDTAFGRIDFARPWETMFVDALRTLLDDVPRRELFSYPNVTSIYLTAGARNPTPYQYLLARVSPPAQIAEAQRILSARQLPYVVVSPMIFTARDPLAAFITAHYESAPIQEIVDAGELPAFWLYRRKAAVGE